MALVSAGSLAHLPVAGVADPEITQAALAILVLGRLEIMP